MRFNRALYGLLLLLVSACSIVVQPTPTMTMIEPLSCRGESTMHPCEVFMDSSCVTTAETECDGLRTFEHVASMKARLEAPSSYAPTSVAAILQLPSCPTTCSPEKQPNCPGVCWKEIQRFAPIEKQAVQVVAELCYINREGDNDLHMELGEPADEPADGCPMGINPFRQLVVEATPHFQQANPAWAQLLDFQQSRWLGGDHHPEAATSGSPALLRRRTKGMLVRVSGLLLRDTHSEGARSGWEIHPVTHIECEDNGGAWVAFKDKSQCAGWQNTPPPSRDPEAPKHRTAVPDPSKYEELSVEVMLDLPCLRPRTLGQWTNDEVQELDKMERRAVSIQGELVWATRETDGPGILCTDLPVPDPDCNCYPRDIYGDAASKNLGDVHIEIRRWDDRDKTWEATRLSHVVVEITPPFLVSHPAWRQVLAKAHYLGHSQNSHHPLSSDPLNQPHGPHIRISGWLFHDEHYSHCRIPSTEPTGTAPPCNRRLVKSNCVESSDDHDGRGTPWEIHPVTRVEVCDAVDCIKDSAWKEPGQSFDAIPSLCFHGF
jgi:hypothetical protein